MRSAHSHAGLRFYQAPSGLPYTKRKHDVLVFLGLRSGALVKKIVEMMFELTKDDEETQPSSLGNGAVGSCGTIIRPCVMFIDVSKDCRILLGLGHLILAPVWSGGLGYYKEADEAVYEKNSLASLSLSSVPLCGSFFNSNGGSERVIVGHDSGELVIYSAVDANGRWALVPQQSATCQSRVECLDLTVNESVTLAGQSDGSVSLYDNETLTPIEFYESAHFDRITGLLGALDEPNMFASSSLDGSALLWDARLPRPACAIFEQNEDSLSGLTSLAWKNNYELAIGCTSGRVMFFDVRSRGPYHEERIGDRPPWKLTFQRETKLLAVTDASETIRVWDTSNKNLAYSDSRHQIQAKNVVWHPTETHKFYSCGFDGLVLSHVISD